MDNKPKRFTIEEHERRMRELLNPPKPAIDRNSTLNKLLEKAKGRVNK